MWFSSMHVPHWCFDAYFSVSIFCPEITCRRSIPPLFAMASIVDSEAQFELRMEQVRLPTALRLALKNSGVCTISALAYCLRAAWQHIAIDDFQAWVRQLDPGATIVGSQR